MLSEHNNNCCVYINVNLFKSNRLNKDHWEINIRAFNWNLENFVSLYTSHSFKRNKHKCYKKTKFPTKYKCVMQNLFADNTILYIYPEAAKWSKNVLSLKKKSVVSLNIYSQAQNRKLKAEYLTIPRKKVQDHSKKSPRNKNNNKIFLGKATGYNDHYMINMVWQRPKTGNNWPLTSPYSQRCDNIFLVMTGTCHKADFLRQHVSCK